jgi:heavy metal sensor kinase
LSSSEGQHVRYLQGPFSVAGQPVMIRVIRTEERMRQTLVSLVLMGLIGLPLAVTLAGLASYALSKRMLEPLTHMTEQARNITADRLHERLPIRNPDDELGSLAGVFNTTFARLENSFDRLRQFTSDASHELRTPLTNIRSVGEVALRESRDGPAYRDAIGSMLEEVDRLAQLADSLLTLSRADGRRVALNPERLDLAEFARDVADDLGVLAEEKGQSLCVEAPEAVHVRADRQVLRHALVNLVDNAVKYAPDGSPIRIVVSQASGGATLEVIDHGPGIPSAHRERVFERFYRIDSSRSREEGGSGLGLAIARWAVETHGGDIELETELGKGCTFRVRLQSASEDEGKEV